MKFGFVDVFSGQDCARLTQAVDGLAAHWVQQAPTPIDFYTLGAASYLDKEYAAEAAATNPILKQSFAADYQRIIAVLEPLFGPMSLIADLSYPGFHIFGAKPGCTSHPDNAAYFCQPRPSALHIDTPYVRHQAVWRQFKTCDFEQTLSFTLALTLPAEGSGLWLWDWIDMADMIKTFEACPEVKRYTLLKEFVADKTPPPAPEIIHNGCATGQHYQRLPQWQHALQIPYQVGRLFYHTGHAMHQIMPGQQLQPTDRRVTLQGHGIRCDGVWRLYF